MPDRRTGTDPGPPSEPFTGTGQAWDGAIRAAIRRHRVERGWSLRQVAERSGGRLKPATLGAYERGDRQMTLAVLGDLADLYGVPVSSFMPSDVASERSAEEVLRVVERLPDRHRSLVAALVMALHEVARPGADAAATRSDTDQLGPATRPARPLGSPRTARRKQSEGSGTTVGEVPGASSLG